MRHRTVAATRSVFAGFLAIAMVAGFSPAFAQIGPVYTACQGPNCPVGSFADLQEAIDEATDAGATGNQALVLVYGGTTWVENLTIDADANIRILGVPLDAQQIIALINADGGDFTLTFRDPLTDTDETTAAIPFDATAADVQAELEALTTIDPGDVIVTGPDGGPYEVQFGGNFVGVRMNLLVANSNLTNTGPEEPFIIVESLEGPQDVVIDGSGSGIVIEVVAEPDMDAADRLIVEGITIQNGSDGVQLVDLDGEDVPFSPTFNRCYIRDNTDNGVRVQGDGDPLLVNCSISENGQSGVFVGDGSGVGSGAFADILHCSIIDNEERGIYVETAGNSARVRNTLVFRNGSGAATQGGVIWEINPFITPSVGPVEGGTFPVTITGSDFGAAPVVYFGPPDKPGTAASPPNTVQPITVNAAGTVITCETPPAWTGAPGPVDVYIERADGFVIRVPNGFTYQAAGTVDPVPIVTRVSPGWGPVDNASTTGIDESAIDVYVYGANFDPECEVWFDFNGSEAINAGIDGQSPRVRWINSGLLLARVPTRATPITPDPVIDVFVRNVPSNEVSPAPPLKEYEYRSITALAPQIDSIVPSRSTELDGGGVTAEIIGANFDPDCVVLIGGILCTYGSVDVSGQVIRNVIVPVSQFGGGGSYDVTVINPDGTWDVLPRGFTYFPTGEPGTDAGTDVWRVANFVERTAGGDRSIFGHGFDFNVDLETGGAPFATIQPIAQREIPFTYFADTDDFAGLLAGVSVVPIDVMNVGTQQGSASTQPQASTTLVYAEQRAIAPGPGRALYFEIESVTAALNPGNPDDISVQILNYQTEMNIYVGDVLVNPADYSAAPASVVVPPGGSATVTFPAPAQPNGVWGPVDVRVELPDTSALNGTGELMYYVAENAYSYRRADQAPEAYSVTPNTVPDNAAVPVLISGANFVGPSGAGVYTRVLLDPDGVVDGDEIDLSTGTYSVISFNSITFAIDLDAVDPTATIPRDAPVDLVLEQYDATAGAVLVSGGNPLRSRLSGAIRFEDATTPPQITSVLNQAGTPTGPVSGYDAVNGADFLVDITGSGFSPGGVVEPIVLFGTAQAEVRSFSDTDITVELPPAPNGLPGIYDVTVIRPSDQISGSLVGGFTYYMDGAPYINEIVPNHMASDEAGPYFVTIRGYNFDDEVDVVFDGPSGPVRLEDVRSISPYEIVVIAPDPASLANDPGDYTAGIATVDVTVQNRADLNAGDAATDGLVSNAVEFFLHNDRENLTANIPELLYNDVYDNNQFDYLNVAPGTGSISIDPALLPDAPWLGKLIVDTDDAPLLNTAGPFTVDPYTITDFEGDVRPTGDGAEIGADEIRDLLDGDSIDQAVWIFARPTPNPVGQMDADELLVELIFTANAISNDAEVFIGPQGSVPSNPAERIPLELFEQIGRGHYLFRNPEPIETLVVDNPPSGLGQGDIVADGHAAIYVEDLVNFPPGREILGYVPGDRFASLDHNDLIQSQAVNGRHFLIDTVPPRIFLEWYENPAIGDYLNAFDIIGNNHNDPLVSGDAEPVSHPFPLPPTGVTVELPATWTPASVLAPVDYNGGLTLAPLAGIDGTKIFFNNGSLALDNAGVSAPGSPLNFIAVVSFWDLPPAVDLDPRPGAVAIDGAATDQDFFTGEFTRQVSGFLPEAVDDPVSDTLEEGEARWILGADSTIFAGVTVNGTYVTLQSGAPNNGAFSPALYPGDSVPSPLDPAPGANDRLDATWTVGPIDATVIPLDHIHGEGVMVATDLAGNSTEDISAFLTDPLHVWWIIDVHSEIFPDLPDGFATKRPYFTMELDRSFNPQPAGGPPPIFTYRIYASPDFCGPYEVRSPWRPWSPNKSIDDIPNYVTEGEWVLLVVIGADEAGNVEKWPLPGSPVDGPIDLCTATPIPGARNWKRFLFTGFDAPETVVDPTFWHDVNDNNNIDNEPNFGSSRLIPLPDDIGIPVRAEFLVSAIRPPGQSAPIRIQWQLIEDGVLADQFIDATTTPGSFDLDVYTANGQVRRITAPVDIATLTGQPGLGDVPLRQRPVTYVYRAAAYFDDNLDTTPDPTDNNGVFDPSAGEIMDPTPANVYFTVVPTGVSNYIKAPTDDDSQPIKEQEIR